MVSKALTGLYAALVVAAGVYMAASVAVSIITALLVAVVVVGPWFLVAWAVKHVG